MSHSTNDLLEKKVYPIVLLFKSFKDYYEYCIFDYDVCLTVQWCVELLDFENIWLLKNKNALH